MNHLSPTRAGQSAAPEQLITRIAPRVTRMAAYYARHCPEEADDLRQEAWLGVVEALPRLDVCIGDPEQYLLRYARWRLLDAVRRSLQHEALVELDEEMAGGGVGHEVLDTLAIVAFLSRLTPIQREIVAGLLAGYTWREVGNAVGCTSANVAYHVRRISERYQAWRANVYASL